VNKAQWRTQCLTQRQQLSAQSIQIRSLALCSHLATVLTNHNQVVLAYRAFRQEPDLRTLFETVPCTWAIPRTVDRALVWHRYDPERLTIGKFGIQEPQPDCPAIAPSEAALVLVPALGCDHQGFRLGYGGGYYDRFLARYSLPTLGICFSEFVFPELPRDAWDQPLGGIVTELGIRLIPREV
jgi:5-formyltetrahydrofolate cyclo-ligase